MGVSGSRALSYSSPPSVPGTDSSSITYLKLSMTCLGTPLLPLYSLLCYDILFTQCCPPILCLNCLWCISGTNVSGVTTKNLIYSNSVTGDEKCSLAQVLCLPIDTAQPLSWLFQYCFLKTIRQLTSLKEEVSLKTSPSPNGTNWEGNGKYS